MIKTWGTSDGIAGNGGEKGEKGLFYLFTFCLLLFCFYELVILCSTEQEATCAVVLEIRNGGEGDWLTS